MKINAKMTKSQEIAIRQLQAERGDGAVTSVNQSSWSNRLSVGLVSGDPADIFAMRYTLYIGKRGRIFETENGDY